MKRRPPVCFNCGTETTRIVSRARRRGVKDLLVRRLCNQKECWDAWYALDEKTAA